MLARTGLPEARIGAPGYESEFATRDTSLPPARPADPGSDPLPSPDLRGAGRRLERERPARL